MTCGPRLWLTWPKVVSNPLPLEENDRSDGGTLAYRDPSKSRKARPQR